MIREEDRPALRRIILAVFCIEQSHRAELQEIIKNPDIPMEERAEKYVNTIIDNLSYYPVGNEG